MSELEAFKSNAGIVSYDDLLIVCRVMVASIETWRRDRVRK